MNILYYYHDVCGLGDFYLLFPVFDALRLKHKDDKITLLAREEIIDIASNKKWFDTCLDTGHTNYPINQYDRVYNWDIQKNGITLFYPPKKHFWDIVETNYDVVLDRSKFSDIFRLDLTDDENIKENWYDNKVIQSWIGDFNPKMIKVCESFLGSGIYQKLTTYRFLFDKKADFIPHPIIK